MGIGMGFWIYEECFFLVINYFYVLMGSQVLEVVIIVGYKQVFGNIGIFDNQCFVLLEVFFCDGCINVQGFMVGLVKFELYKQKFFYVVFFMCGIEFIIKYLLGCFLINQKEVSVGIQLIVEEGFDVFVDSLVCLEEYLEIFGIDMVFYLCGFKLEVCVFCFIFVGMVEIILVNVSFENVMYIGFFLVKCFIRDFGFFVVVFVYLDDSDCGGFFYMNVVSNFCNVVYCCMYGGKFNYGCF